MLYIVSTPIGNLADISLRALETLKSVNAILCEDTRVSKNLLNFYQIQTPLISYHCFNEKKRVDEIIERMNRGESFALISDAGTPLFQDPGFILIQACYEHGIPLTTIPGASSILSALVLSGFALNQFQFLGFLDKKTSDAESALKKACLYEGLSVFFESPKRLVSTLELIHKINQQINICVVREITKKFETAHRGKPSSLIEEFTKNSPRGEIVIIIEGQPAPTDIDMTSTCQYQ